MLSVCFDYLLMLNAWLDDKTADDERVVTFENAVACISFHFSADSRK